MTQPKTLFLLGRPNRLTAHVTHPYLLTYLLTYRLGWVVGRPTTFCVSVLPIDLLLPHYPLHRPAPTSAPTSAAT